MHGIESHSEHGLPVQVRLQKNLFDALEDWRRRQAKIPSRPQAIRDLLQRAICQDVAEAGDDGRCAAA
jgi:metal-responsive CopG/Arc/MetJ family transcriptional regulator